MKSNRHKHIPGPSPETDRGRQEEFNPVKTKLEDMSARELLYQFGLYYSNSKLSFYGCIDPFLEQFNPVKPTPKEGDGDETK